ncbi:Methanol O-anthraniloyltransferase [Nymphaea thermarum]|nr:Methanol O-anthraniloyltransferase [Nymphaea thermarum]
MGSILTLHQLPFNNGLSGGEEMKIKVRDSSLVLPFSETPRHALWLSKLDRAMFTVHVPSVYFYRPNGSNNFFDTKVMKESLGRALVPFYPLAGRLRRRKDGPLEIDCNGDGALFVEADAEGEIDDFGDFAPSVELRQLIPEVDYQNQDISSYPLLMLQVTFFKCGGVGLGVGMHHTVVDAGAAIHFMNSWSDVARGMEVNCPPFIDRTILRARSPPRITFVHLEYMPSTSLEPRVPTEVPSKQKPQNTQLSGAIFRFSKDQLARLKEKVNEGNTSTTKYTIFNSLVVHLWSCVCLARGLDDLQPTKLSIPIDGRKILRPEIPNHYLGNVVFIMALALVAGDLKSRSMHYVASLDYLEQQPDLGGLVGRAGYQKWWDLNISSLARLPVHDADFGWGKPIHIGTVAATVDGLGYILPSPSDDGSLSIVITLQTDAMRSLAKIIYDI